MEEIQINIDEQGRGAFLLRENEEQLGEMVVSVNGNTLIVYHTEVVEKAEGRGLAKKLLAAMVEYSRKNKLTVLPLCPYVHLQFKRHPDQYADVWNRNEPPGQD